MATYFYSFLVCICSIHLGLDLGGYHLNSIWWYLVPGDNWLQGSRPPWTSSRVFQFCKITSENGRVKNNRNISCIERIQYLFVGFISWFHSINICLCLNSTHTSQHENLMVDCQPAVRTYLKCDIKHTLCKDCLFVNLQTCTTRPIFVKLLFYKIFCFLIIHEIYNHIIFP